VSTGSNKLVEYQIGRLTEGCVRFPAYLLARDDACWGRVDRDSSHLATVESAWTAWKGRLWVGNRETLYWKFPINPSAVQGCDGLLVRIGHRPSTR
jgi:hypothetical protein